MKCTQYGLLFWIFSALVNAADDDDQKKFGEAMDDLDSAINTLYKITPYITLENTQATRFKYREYLRAFFNVLNRWDPFSRDTWLYDKLIENMLVEYDPEQYMIKTPDLYVMTNAQDSYLSEKSVESSNVYLTEKSDPSFFRAFYRYVLQVQIYVCLHPFIVIKLKIHGIREHNLSNMDDNNLLATLVELYCLKKREKLKPHHVLLSDELAALEDVKLEWAKLPESKDKTYLMELIDALENGMEKIPLDPQGPPPPPYKEHDREDALKHSDVKANQNHQSGSIGQNERIRHPRRLLKRISKWVYEHNGHAQTKKTKKHLVTTAIDPPLNQKKPYPSESPTYGPIFVITPRRRRRFFNFREKSNEETMVLRYYQPPPYEHHPSSKFHHTEGE